MAPASTCARISSCRRLRTHGGSAGRRLHLPFIWKTWTATANTTRVGQNQPAPLWHERAAAATAAAATAAAARPAHATHHTHAPTHTHMHTACLDARSCGTHTLLHSHKHTSTPSHKHTQTHTDTHRRTDTPFYWHSSTDAVREPGSRRRHTAAKGNGGVRLLCSVLLCAALPTRYMHARS
jgi:hypothetical protein